LPESEIAFNGHHKIKSPAQYRIGGRVFTTAELGRLSAAPDGTELTFISDQSRIAIVGENRRYFEDGKPIRRNLVNTPSGLVIVNVQLEIKPEFRRSGVGFNMLKYQIEAARQLKVENIACLAARWGKDENYQRVELDGYMVWPKLGFDGPIPDAVRPLLGSTFQQLDTIQQLVQADGGWKEWKQHGAAAHLTFDVASGSVHSEFFAAYGQKKGLLK
jgi:hypothetical protein